MNRLITVGKLAALLGAAFAFVALGLFALELRKTAVRLAGVADESRATVIEGRRRMVDTSQNLNAILLQIGIASDEFRRAATEQRVYWNKSGQQTVAALRKSNNVLDQLQATTRSVDDSQKQIAKASVLALQSLRPAAESSAFAMQKAAEDLESLNTILRDQNIPQTLAHVNDTAAHLDSMSNSLDVAVKQWTKPRSLFKSLLFGGLDVSSKVAIIAK